MFDFYNRTSTVLSKYGFIIFKKIFSKVLFQQDQHKSKKFHFLLNSTSCTIFQYNTSNRNKTETTSRRRTSETVTDDPGPSKHTVDRLSGRLLLIHLPRHYCPFLSHFLVFGNLDHVHDFPCTSLLFR